MTSSRSKQLDELTIVKKCSVCKLELDFSKFSKQSDKKYGLSCACKECLIKRRSSPKNKEKQTKLNKKYWEKNSDSLKEKGKEYYYSNKESCLKNKKEYYENNKEEKIQKQKDYYLLNKEARNKYNKEYHAKNKEVLREKNNAWKRSRRKSNIKYKLSNNMATSLYSALKKNKNFKKWGSFVDYTVDHLMSHLESKFTAGMNWDNYGIGGWHIDHIIPQSFFTWDTCDHPAFKACWALSNLQPLWATTEIAISYGEDSSYIGNFDKNNKIKISDDVKEYLDSINMKDKNEI